jgi:hypothetical protein
VSITLNELMRLREDKSTFSRIESLIEQRNKATKALEAAHAELANSQKELARLGITIDATGTPGRKRGRPLGSVNKKTGAKPGPKPGRKPGRPKGSGGGSRKSAEDYQAALNAIGVEMSKAGLEEIKGPDIVSAMAKKGFGSKQVVMIQLRENPSWKMQGVKRAARYHYKKK